MIESSRRIGRCIAVAALLMFLTSAAHAQHPHLPGFDRFLSEPGADQAEAGRFLINELQCVACHTTEKPVIDGIAPNRAPLLGDVGARLKPQWIKAYLDDPQKTKPGTRMPGPPHGIPEQMLQQGHTALTHYLASLQGDKPLPVLMGKIADGKKLFNEVGCAACHTPLGDEASVKDGKSTVPLPDLAAKYQNASALAAFLMEPHRWRPAGRMPKLNLTKEEALSIAVAFGLPGGGARVGVRDSDDEALKKAGLDKELVAGVYFEMYQGSWNALPEFDRLKPSDAGSIAKFDISKGNGEDNFAFRFRGYIDIPRDGVYTFYTHSDDGSRLVIGRDLVVDNDRIQGGTEKAGSIELKKGLHAITASFFEAQGGEELDVRWEGPGINKQSVPARVLSHSKTGKFIIGSDAKPVEGFVPEPALVAIGKKLFTDIGCATCHQMKESDKPSPMTLQPKSLAALKGMTDKGCLAEKPTGHTVNYSFSKAQREAIVATLKTIDVPSPLAASHRIDLTMSTLNCYACHSRGSKGGPEEGHKKHFTGTYDDLADEGRLPPHLGDVGAKLTAGWLNEILTKGTKVRPYMNTRMPVFGSAVSHLVADFEKADAIAAPVSVPEVSTRDAMKHGRELVGTGGMACVQCHTFAGKKSLGLPAMDLAYMPQRLKREWFGRYLLDPARLRPGTRMPQFWPEGKSVRSEILDGKTDVQIEALWQYLSKGNEAPPPPGINSGEILLVAETEAVLYRNFIAGAGPRAIGVGYPGKVNIAWDANVFRLALAWHGEFIDASKHWVDRGSGFQGPYGYDVLSFPEAGPFALLPSMDSVWPMAKKINNVTKSEGYEFVGYQLDKLRRPTFMYTFGKDVKVSEFYEGVPPVNKQGEPGLKRTITIELAGPVKDLNFLAAIHGSIEAQSDGSFAIGKEYKVKIDSPVKAQLRQAGGKKDVVVPITGNGKVTIVLTYTW
ncbi:MAG: PA14 domain-containing protein [Phycisphaeraceae bacterium]